MSRKTTTTTTTIKTTAAERRTAAEVAQHYWSGARALKLIQDRARETADMQAWEYQGFKIWISREKTAITKDGNVCWIFTKPVNLAHAQQWISECIELQAIEALRAHLASCKPVQLTHPLQPVGKRVSNPRKR